jgi:25S rRNA (adenine2142-N1)-methyltransferase
MRSRKKARVVTTLFHKYTRDRELALQQGDSLKAEEYEEKIAEIGGHQEYQRASQLSTSHHSTSKWVLGVLAKKGWLHGIATSKKPARRQALLLEVGAINTELLNAASERLDVRAIDLHSMHEGIEEVDFLTLPPCHQDPNQRYDVVVCSMVINCVPTPEKRGTMLTRLFHHLAPGGLCFLTLPKLCLTQSPYMSTERFQSLLLSGVGFELEETKESPKVAFFILRRPLNTLMKESIEPQWTASQQINKGKKYRNKFAVILNQNDVNGQNLFETRAPTTNDKDTHRIQCLT